MMIFIAKYIYTVITFIATVAAKFHVRTKVTHIYVGTVGVLDSVQCCAN